MRERRLRRVAQVDSVGFSAAVLPAAATSANAMGFRKSAATALKAAATAATTAAVEALASDALPAAVKEAARAVASPPAVAV